MKTKAALDPKPALPALLALFFLTATLSVFAGPAQTKKAANDSYLWHAELVTLDQNTMTVKSWIVGEEAPKQMAAFKRGEKIALTWSGLADYASGIREATKYDAAKKMDDHFTFPVEFVSYDAAHRYVTFKVPVAAQSIANIKSLKPGEWITATSPHGQASAAQPIATVRPYVGSSTVISN